MYNFKVGEIAILQSCYHPELNGEECEILSGAMMLYSTTDCENPDCSCRAFISRKRRLLCITELYPAKAAAALHWEIL